MFSLSKRPGKEIEQRRVNAEKEEVLQNDKQTGLTDSKLRLMVSFKLLIHG